MAWGARSWADNSWADLDAGCQCCGGSTCCNKTALAVWYAVTIAAPNAGTCVGDGCGSCANYGGTFKMGYEGTGCQACVNDPTATTYAWGYDPTAPLPCACCGNGCGADMVCYWPDPATGCWAQQSGDFVLQIGSTESEVIYACTNANFNPLGTSTFNYVRDFGACTNWPATCTVVPTTPP